MSRIVATDVDVIRDGALWHVVIYDIDAQGEYHRNDDRSTWFNNANDAHQFADDIASQSCHGRSR